ncbi:MAG TPA: DNA-binding domain-containing protein, partial [Planctomycetaceae bacterium]
EQAERIVAPSRALSSVERLEIYHQAYFARLLECLRHEYSVLAAALGNDLFDAFAVGYLQSHPSTSYTLEFLGAHFPEHLAETRPSYEAGPGAAADWPDFIIDLARLERAVNEVFDGPGVEGQPLLDSQRLAAILPEEWPTARLICVPCLRVVALQFPVNDYFTAVRQGRAMPVPQPAPEFVAVTRRDYRVLRYTLDRAQYELLQALICDKPVGTAIEQAAAVSPMTDEALATQLRDWFENWTASGFFRGVELR